jgi:DNA helicase-2/ATP-dependent DNA helicase PcrA
VAKKKQNLETVGQLNMMNQLQEVSYTDEQKEFVEYFGNDSVILSATAGSGKTFSCVQRLKELLKKGVDPSKIIFFSFTKAATEELQKRIQRDDVKITTIHAFSLGLLAKMGKYKKISVFYDFIKWYKDEKKPPKTASKEAKQEFYELIGSLYDEMDYISSEISAYKLQIADDIKCPMPLFFLQYQEFLKKTRSRDFADMLIEVRDLLKEDKWLKMFRGKYDYIFIDEYQDTSTIQLQILLSLNAKYYYLIGDKNQCLLPETKINTKDGIKSIKDVSEGDFVLAGKGSGNLKYSLVTKKIINENKNYKIVKIRTKDKKELICTNNHIVFANYEKQLKNRFFVYLMYKENIGFRIGMTQLYNSNKVALKNSLNFKSRLVQEQADKIWLIYTSEEYLKTRVEELKFSLNYGIPTIVFKNINKKNSLIGEDYINIIFKEIDTYERGFLLLKKLNYSFEHPHYTPQSNSRERKNINLFLCADGRGKNGLSRIEIDTNKQDDIKNLENEFNIKFYKHKSKDSWRFRKHSTEFKLLYDLANEISKKTGYQIRTKACLAKGKYFNLLPASQVLEGMQVYLHDSNKVKIGIVEDVIKDNYQGVTYDLNVEKVHNFCANSFFVHNSIYGYSGANCKKIELMLKNRRKTIEKTLSVNFRSDKEIINNSNRFSDLKAVSNSKKQGFVKKYIIFQIEPDGKNLSLMDVLEKHSEIAILVRTNSVIKKLEFELLKKKYPMRYFNYITNSDFKEWKKGDIHVKLQEKLDKLKPYFDNNEMNIFAFIEQNKNSNKLITSIHKSKGREFEYCVVVNSIDPDVVEEVGLHKVLSKKQMQRVTFDPLEQYDLEPKNIHYVAVSRAKHGLYYMLYDF